MSDLMNRVNSLKRAADNMKLSMDEETGKLLLDMLALMGEMAGELHAAREELAELNEYVESLDDDLADLAESFLGDDEDAMDEDEFFAEDEDDEDDLMGDDELICYACPHCGHEIEFNPSDVDFDEDYLCPKCGKPVFPEIDEEG